MTGLQIGALNLSLPPEFHHRAGTLAREIGAALNRQLLAAGLFEHDGQHLARINVPALHLNPALSDKRLGMQIATAIRRQIQTTCGEETSPWRST